MMWFNNDDICGLWWCRLLCWYVLGRHGYVGYVLGPAAHDVMACLHSVLRGSHMIPMIFLEAHMCHVPLAFMAPIDACAGILCSITSMAAQQLRLKPSPYFFISVRLFVGTWGGLVCNKRKKNQKPPRTMRLSDHVTNRLDYILFISYQLSVISQ